MSQNPGGSLWDLRQGPSPNTSLVSGPSWTVGSSETSKRHASLPAEGPPLSNTTFPHILPLITLLECDTAPAEGPEPWGSTEHGVEVVLAHLEAARTVAHHGGLYHTNAEVKLQGESLVAFRGQATADHAAWASLCITGFPFSSKHPSDLPIPLCCPVSLTSSFFNL